MILAVMIQLLMADIGFDTYGPVSLKTYMGYDVFGPVFLDIHIYTFGYDVFGPVSLNTNIQTIGFDVFGPVTIDNRFAYAAPLDVTVTVDNNEVLIQWGVVSGATYYKIYSASSPDAVFPDSWNLAADNITSLNWTDMSFSAKKFYRVVAVDSGRRLHASSNRE